MGISNVVVPQMTIEDTRKKENKLLLGVNTQCFLWGTIVLDSRQSHVVWSFLWSYCFQETGINMRASVTIMHNHATHGSFQFEMKMFFSHIATIFPQRSLDVLDDDRF